MITRVSASSLAVGKPACCEIGLITAVRRHLHLKLFIFRDISASFEPKIAHMYRLESEFELP